MSDHEVRVLRVEEIVPHDNADTLEIAKIYGYNCIVRKGDFSVGDLGAFVEPDYMAPIDSPEFSFLRSKAKRSTDTHVRVKKIKLRGVSSEGILVKARGSWSEGDNVMEELGVIKYEPPLLGGGRSGYEESSPKLKFVTYDLEPYKKHKDKVSIGDPVIITGKIHGANARFVYHDGKMYAGSHRTWKKKPGQYTDTKDVHVKDTFLGSMSSWVKSLFGKEKWTGTKKTTVTVTYTASDSWWWKATRDNTWIEDWCMAHPGVILYGEVYGPCVQGDKFHYGLKGDEIGFAVFDVFEDGDFVDNHLLFEHEEYDELEKVELLYRGPFTGERLLAECANSECPKNGIREGAVLKHKEEHYTASQKRVAFKYISDKYDEMH